LVKPKPIANKNGIKILNSFNLKKMKKQIVLTPEWVLEKIPFHYNVDGNGNVMFYTNEPIYAELLKLALDSFEISYRKNDSKDNRIIFGFVFKIESLKENCPNFYMELKELDNDAIRYINKLRQ